MGKQDFFVKQDIRLSARMSALADMVTPGNRLADVGCDHGYIPIYLCRTGKIPSAIAMDINEGPLERARQHVEECGLSNRIQTRISDGLKSLGEDEADTVLIAGMGGCLTCRILMAEDDLRKDAAEKIQTVESRSLKNGTEQNCTGKSRVPASVTELALQPQSDISSVRRCVREIGFCIVDEDMVEEDGKFYPMMKATKGCPRDGEQGTTKAFSACGTENMLADAFGPVLLRKRHPVLKRWLEKELLTTERILRQLEDARSDPGDKRNSLAEESSFVENAGSFPGKESSFVENAGSLPGKESPPVENVENLSAGNAAPARDRENRVTERFQKLLHKKEMIAAALSYYDDTRGDI